MTTNVPVAVSITLQNTGGTAWAVGDYYLGSQNPQDNTAWGLGRVSLAGPVAPGANATFNFNVTAPTTPGIYNFQWRMVQDGVGWFGAFSTNVIIDVQGAPAATMYFIHTDHLNTPRVITNQAQQVVWRWDHTEPFGSNPPNENPSGLGVFECNLRLPGQYFDKETNLHYNYFRDYDPGSGRYIQADPLGITTTRFPAPTTGVNHLYAYVTNNPLSLIDPLGLAVEDPGLFGDFIRGLIEKLPGEAEGRRLGGLCISKFCKERRRPKTDDEITEFCVTQIVNPHSIFANAILGKCIQVCKSIVNQPGFPASCPASQIACLTPAGGI